MTPILGWCHGNSGVFSLDLKLTYLFSANSTDSNFEPPPAARPTKPEVKSKPAGDITDINFSGILGSNTVLRQHCEQCVLRDKPEDFRSVLFVCQL